MFKHILVATDTSPLADKALALALELASENDSTRITALMVTPDYGTPELVETTFSNGPSVQALREQHAAAAQRRLDAQVQRLRAARPDAAPVKARVETQVAINDQPYDAIVSTAERLECDLIVMAARGRGALAAALLGSQTARVLALATVPVLVVK